MLSSFTPWWHSTPELICLKSINQEPTNILSNILWLHYGTDTVSLHSAVVRIGLPVIICFVHWQTCYALWNRTAKRWHQHVCKSLGLFGWPTNFNRLKNGLYKILGWNWLVWTFSNLSNHSNKLIALVLVSRKVVLILLVNVLCILRWNFWLVVIPRIKIVVWICEWIMMLYTFRSCRFVVVGVPRRWRNYKRRLFHVNHNKFTVVVSLATTTLPNDHKWKKCQPQASLRNLLH